MGLDEDFSGRPGTSDGSMRDLVKAINSLNTSINHLLKLFEDANQEIIDQYHDNKVPIKEKLEEISDQNEKIASGIVGIADMVKGDSGDSEPSSPVEGDMPELEEPPKHDFDMGFKEDELQDASFNNKSGVTGEPEQPLDAPTQAKEAPAQPAPQQSAAEPKPPITNAPDVAPLGMPSQDEAPQGFGGPDPFDNQDPFAQNVPGQPPGMPPGGSPGPAPGGFPPDSDFQPPQMPPPAQPGPSPQPVGPPGRQPMADPFPQPQQFQQQPVPGQMNQPGPMAQPGMTQIGPEPDLPPSVPEPPKKKGLFSILKK